MMGLLDIGGVCSLNRKSVQLRSSTISDQTDAIVVSKKRVGETLLGNQLLYMVVVAFFCFVEEQF